jgi:hypothetical protein
MPIINKPKHPETKKGGKQGTKWKDPPPKDKRTGVGRFSLYVRTVGSGFHNHFKEPLKLSLILLTTFEGFRVVEKNNSHSFSTLLVLIEFTSPSFQHWFSQASDHNFFNAIF